MSEIVNRPVMRQCPHPDKDRSRVDTAWRVWYGRFYLGTIYQLSPGGRWFAVNVTGQKVSDNFRNADAASQHLLGQFELHKPRPTPEEEAKSPFLKYPRDKHGEPEQPPQT